MSVSCHPACSTNHGLTGESSLSGSCVLLSMWHLTVRTIPCNSIIAFSMSPFDSLSPFTASSVVTSALLPTSTIFGRFFSVLTVVFVKSVEHCVPSFSTPSSNVSCLAARPTYSGYSFATLHLPFSSILSAALLPRVHSSILSTFAALLIPILTIAESPFSFACSFVDSLQRKIQALSPSSFAAIPTPLEHSCHPSCFCLTGLSTPCQQ